MRFLLSIWESTRITFVKVNLFAINVLIVARPDDQSSKVLSIATVKKTPKISAKKVLVEKLKSVGKSYETATVS